MEQSPGVFRIAIIEDHLLQRSRTEEILGSQPDMKVVFSGESAPAFLTWLRESPRENHPQLLILDLMVDRAPSVDPGLVKAFIEAGLLIVVLSALASPALVRDVVQAGVHAVVGKRDSEDAVVSAIRAALDGESWMTTELASVIAADPSRPKLSIQEERALVLYASGLSLDDLAAVMNVSPNTAKQYINRVKAKYSAAGVEARTRLDLGRIAWAEGYVDPTLPPSQPTA